MPHLVLEEIQIRAVWVHFRLLDAAELVSKLAVKEPQSHRQRFRLTLRRCIYLGVDFVEQEVKDIFGVLQPACICSPLHNRVE